MIIPEAFRNYPQFVLYNVVDKVPFNPVFPGKQFDPMNPLHQMTAEQAEAGLSQGTGIGFVFTERDPFFFLDIDKAYRDGQWSELATRLLGIFTPACYYESSISGTGCHVFGTLTTDIEHACKNIPSQLEFYTTDRYVALTGNNACGDPTTLCDDQIKWLVDAYFKKTVKNDVEWTDGPVPEWHGPTDDNGLIGKMYNSKSVGGAFGSKMSFKELWDCEDPQNHDQSSLDQSLCNLLAFWTGKDCERMDRLFRLSALGKRDKWVIREDYRRATILNACSVIKTVYGKSAEINKQTGERRTDIPILYIDNQIEYFKDCTYITELNKILVPNGSLLDSPRFKAVYGGYAFMLSDSHGSKTTPDAWKAFTESQGYVFPKVDDICFRPDKVSQEIITDNLGRTAINIYIPPVIRVIKGDVSPFMDHIKSMFPEDHEILIAWMAAVVQYPGFKFRWAPLIQGVEGNGKSLISDCLTMAISRKYTTPKNAGDLGNKFNLSMESTVLIVVEEVNIGGKYDTMELLKPMITQEFIEIQGKGDNQRGGTTCANFVLFTNHKDGLIITIDGRRYAPFFAAQQRVGDLQPDKYFYELFKWAKKDGYLKVINYLKEYQIPDELNPTIGAQRAPLTSVRKDAVVASHGHTEQRVIQAVAEGRKGFCGGWVSSIALSRLIDGMRVKGTPVNKRPDMLESLGYVKHPGLNQGRVNNPLVTEGNRKPRLYVLKDSIQSGITGGSSITQAYIKAQSEAPQAGGIAEQVFAQ